MPPLLLSPARNLATPDNLGVPQKTVMAQPESPLGHLCDGLHNTCISDFSIAVVKRHDHSNLQSLLGLMVLKG